MCPAKLNLGLFWCSCIWNLPLALFFFIFPLNMFSLCIFVWPKYFSHLVHVCLILSCSLCLSICLCYFQLTCYFFPCFLFFPWNTLQFFCMSMSVVPHFCFSSSCLMSMHLHHNGVWVNIEFKNSHLQLLYYLFPAKIFTSWHILVTFFCWRTWCLLIQNVKNSHHSNN